jgi:hypothetical protein
MLGKKAQKAMSAQSENRFVFILEKFKNLIKNKNIKNNMQR